MSSADTSGYIILHDFSENINSYDRHYSGLGTC